MPIVRNAKVPVKEHVAVHNKAPVTIRDPRFEGYAGSLNKKMFRKAYSFMSQERVDRINELKKAQKKKGIDMDKKQIIQKEIMLLRDAQCKYENEEKTEKISKSMRNFHVKQSDKKYLVKASNLQQLECNNGLEDYIQKTITAKEKKKSMF